MARLVSTVRDRGIGMAVRRHPAKSAGLVQYAPAFYSRGVVRDSVAQSEITV